MTVYPGPPVALGSIFVDTKVAFGYLATSKKSGVFRCPVSSSSSVTTEPVSMSIVTRLWSALLPNRSIVPLNCLKDPLWLLVTFAATNSTFEFSGDITSVSAPAGFAGFVSGAAFVTEAFGLFAAGFAHAKLRTAIRIGVTIKR